VEGRDDYASIGLPMWVLDSYGAGRLFTVEQLADGRLVLTPVAQPPTTRA
jgi:hypothetical protein